MAIDRNNHHDVQKQPHGDGGIHNHAQGEGTRALHSRDVDHKSLRDLPTNQTAQHALPSMEIHHGESAKPGEKGKLAEHNKPREEHGEAAKNAAQEKTGMSGANKSEQQGKPGAQSTETGKESQAEKDRAMEQVRGYLQKMGSTQDAPDQRLGDGSTNGAKLAFNAQSSTDAGRNGDVTQVGFKVYTVFSAGNDNYPPEGNPPGGTHRPSYTTTRPPVQIFTGRAGNDNGR